VEEDEKLTQWQHKHFILCYLWISGLHLLFNLHNTMLSIIGLDFHPRNPKWSLGYKLLVVNTQFGTQRTLIEQLDKMLKRRYTHSDLYFWFILISTE
jgi:hypothetical protein